MQFGPSKCNSMLIGKNTEYVVNSPIMVDNWTVEYMENRETGEVDLKEHYAGLVEVEKTDEQKYLGFVVSCQGNNMANIRQIEKKSIGVVRKVINKLNSLNLGKYYFECSIILMNVILRGSILYACEMYYNLKESELRKIEQIEEGFMRNVLNTPKGCPTTQLYLELGQIPARFEIQKMRLLYLKYILNEEEDSLLRKFFMLQLEKSSKGDWAWTCVEDLRALNITESFDEIKNMTKIKFSRILKSRTRQNALKYLIEKRKSKGKEIIYSEISMAEYMLPTNTKLSIYQKQTLFSIRNRMIDIPSNFSKTNKEAKCICGNLENMKHIYECEILNNGKDHKQKYKKLFEGRIEEQIEVFDIFEKNLKRRDELKF